MGGSGVDGQGEAKRNQVLAKQKHNVLDTMTDHHRERRFFSLERGD